MTTAFWKRLTLFVLLAIYLTAGTAGWAAPPATVDYQLSVFQADITIPLGHRCMGILPIKAHTILDPLEARGLVLQGADKPIVLLAADWCEIRNGAYDRWRNVLADAAGTTPERVLVVSLHQHDAPVADLDAEKLLAGVGLAGELCDVDFHEQCVQRVAEALRDSLEHAQPITHIGLGKGKVEQVASNRRHVTESGQVTFARGSNSGGQAQYREAPAGLIDPWLKTLSFWNGEHAVAAVSAYAVHPMSYYGKGEVSADFVGMARRWQQRDEPQVHQIYLSGCSGDVTAGKYNDGSPAMRPVLADRLYQAMKQAWQSTRRVPLTQVAFRSTKLELPFNDEAAFTADALRTTLEDKQADMRDRILAAMSLASRQRVERGQKIDVPCVDLGAAQLVLLPGEAFVGYQLMAQEIADDSFVLCAGYSECWPGYIPTRAAFEEGFGHSWRWVAPGSEAPMRRALEEVLK